MNAILAILIASTFAFTIWQYGLRLFYGYRITKSAIEIRALGILTIKKFRLDDILEIWLATFMDLVPFCNPKALGVFRWGNRLFGDILILRLKHHMFNYVSLTPDNTEQFLKEITDKQPNIIIHLTDKW
ncbi:MAG TPA: hypothetical protein VL981_03145 [Candidatus Methylacidiphilales bacterium]|nr:hypothetical protein [Candidatus Methylacidiphilales bacterium]